MPPSRRALVLLVLVSASSCTTRIRHVVSPARPLALSDDRPVRVLLANDGQLLLEHPRVLGDSLTGNLVGRSGTAPERAAVALRDVRVEQQVRFDALRTVLLTAAVVVGAAILYVVAALQTL